METLDSATQETENQPTSIYAKGGKFAYRKCIDGRGRQVPGIWRRDEKFYGAITVPGKGTRLKPLLDEHNSPVRTLTAAIEAKAELNRRKKRGELPGPRITPIFRDYFPKYIEFLEETRAKNPLTIAKEKGSLKCWSDFLGETRLNQITRKHINDFAVYRAKEDKVTNRTINLDVIALNHLLHFAKDEGWIHHTLPTADWKDLKHVTAKRQLLPDDALDRLVAEALSTKEEDGKTVPKYENGQFLADYLRLLAYSGARRMAGLSARWDNVDFKNRQIAFNTKFDKRVVVDFNPKLEELLLDMKSRRTSEVWLFPSPCPGDVVGHIVTPHKTLNAVREAAGLPDFHLHDLRHAFISHCVMLGFDWLTIAKWVGHADGGVLIGKTYGHLRNEHTQALAAKMDFNYASKPEAQKVEPVKPDLSQVPLTELLAMVQQRLATEQKVA